jgi:hypothetical protein
MCKKIKPHFLGVSLFLFAFVGATSFTGFGNDDAFDSAAWLNAGPRDRGRMAQSLVDGGTLVGQSAEVVLQTLGMPEKNWGRVVQYQIDLGWPLKKSTTYGLQVHFSDNIVREVKIVD